MVLYTRLLPVVRTFISLPAGIARMRWTKFLLFTAIGSAVWNTALAYLGWAFGSNWDQFQAQFAKFTYIIIGSGAVIILALIGWLFWKLRKRPHASGGAEE